MNLIFFIFTLLITTFSAYANQSKPTPVVEQLKEDMNISNQDEMHVFKRTLSNGMTILARVVDSLPKVSVQLWYNVGGKDEKTGEKGIAHLIEHMIFKGTKKLSESDINVITHMLSGSTNAFTSLDYTGYEFELPAQHWHEILPIMADCMENVSFKEDHLNSEMKAVIQELKMYRDNYTRNLIMDYMLPAIFPDHPYHYPLIGFKQDLWNAHSEDLRKFYKKHYLPNNATLVVVGDVDPEEVFKLAEQCFGSIKANPAYKKEQFFFHQDIVAKEVTLYRDVQQPTVIAAWVVPGAKEKVDQILDIITWIIGSGKGSRLYKKLVDGSQLVNSLEAFTFTLFDHGLFFIAYEPKKMADNNKILTIINEEITDLAQHGPTKLELVRAIKKAQMNYYGILEDIESQASEIGKYYLALHDENYIFNYLKEPTPDLAEQVQELFAHYLRPAVTHKGYVLPLPESEHAHWLALQEASDKEDTEFLTARVRTTPIEPPLYAKQVKVKEAQIFNFPKAQTFTLSNGLKVLYYNNENTPKIDIILEFKAKSYYDPENRQGLNTFLSQVLSEGTQKYTASQLADELESRGMAFGAAPGKMMISMLSTDFEKGLELLKEIVLHPRFDDKEIEKVREQLLAGIKNFWDEPKLIAGQLVSEHIYKGHPYSKNALGTEKSITVIDKKELQQAYKDFITPDGAKMAIVGDVHAYDVPALIKKVFGDWKGTPAKSLLFPVVSKPVPTQVSYPMNRDQVVLVFAGLSVDRKNPDYDKLLLFDQIFSGGALGSMHSRLFQLREASGLFYTIGGSLVSQADEQPGMVLIKTIVSVDRLNEAEKAIKQTVKTVLDTLTLQEFTEARHAIISSLISLFESNQSIASVFLWQDRYDFPVHFFDKRAEQLGKITFDQMKEAVKKVLRADDFVIFKVGRVENNNADK